MARKVTGTGVEPVERPQRRQQPPDPEEVEAVEPATDEQEQEDPKNPNPRAYEYKTKNDRHPCTVQPKVFRRDAAEEFATWVTNNENLNPDGVKVYLGTLGSLIFELACDCVMDNGQGLETLRNIANAEDPKSTLALMLIQYKLAQKKRGKGSDEEVAEDAVSTIDPDLIAQMLGTLMAADKAV